jgi:EAL domain-containing protein (putative c-di-GMP-specific phosphodiesterase class I)
MEGMMMELYTLFQPIMDLKNKKVLGYEALLRGPLPPEQLFKRARKTNSIVNLDIYAMNLSIQSFNAKGMTLFLNCHPLSFYTQTLLPIFDQWKYTHLQPAQIVVELTEQQKITNIQDTIDAAKFLKSLGVKIAIDDFGKGFSNLSLIESIEPHYIKLDQSISKNIVHNKKVQSLVSGLQTIATQIQSNLIVEGIETREQKNTIQQCGIQFGQGWLLGQPNPLPSNPPMMIS